MFGLRGSVAFLVAGCLLLGFEGYSAQDGDYDGDHDDDGDDLAGYTGTYRPRIEKFYQGLLERAQSSQSNDSFDENADITSDLSDSLKPIISGVENTTKRAFGDFLNMFEKNFHLIFPGTLWCGAGNISKNGDVGLFEKTDACCRAHDKCPSDIAPGQTKGNLVNNGAYTRSACSCDHQFYDCLKNASSIIADEIGLTYFDILGPQCFEYNYPTTNCTEYGTRRILKKPCEEYNFDTSKNKTLIWVDNPVY